VEDVSIRANAIAIMIKNKPNPANAIARTPSICMGGILPIIESMTQITPKTMRLTVRGLPISIWIAKLTMSIMLWFPVNWIYRIFV
jgi:hypothetical protein